MKLEKIPAWVRYLISYAVYVVLAIWLLSAVRGWANHLAQTAYRVGPMITMNIVSLAIPAVFLLFRTHQSIRLGKEGIVVCAVLFVLSVCLTAFAYLNNNGWEAITLLAAEELYDLVMLLRARRNAKA